MRQSGLHEAPPPRDRLPTLPEDLSEYAWIHTGPPSERPMAVHDAPRRDETDEASSFDDMTAGLLVDLWHSDVPCMVSPDASALNEREFRLMTLIDGCVTVKALLETSGLPLPDVLGSLCELVARGVITLDRSARLPR